MNTTPDVHQMTIQQLRDEGYAVIVWTPEELGDCPADAIEDASIERGWDIIDYYRSDNE